ncbi:UNVERIFIED_CONTAM: hypothetical protein PYX00_003986 [Menopon gallinae]|uniref:Dynamin-type G domain-containing protein n=1 Tax=Menopon gallinae TaxID=328185 RepID=A0AAW2I2K6_9NEOP
MFTSWCAAVNSVILKPRNCRLLFWRPEPITDSLKNAYKEKLLPLEERHLFHYFHSQKYSDVDFESKPMILLMGQYSTGKTTLIRYLLGTDFPGMRIGPEPTTDKFIAIMHDTASKVIPGNALVMDPSKPFGPLAKYGNAFLTRFQCSMLNNSVLQNLTLVDTPGILSGEKQRVDRGYDFTGVLHWFAERVDRIILLFDAHKLDISDEFKWSIESLKGFDDKIMILLNKADMVDHQSLMRIYGSLMWSLDKVLSTPEVPKVYVGSFWDQSSHSTINRKLFEDEEHDLISELQSLPRNGLVRKINDLAKRARLAKSHAIIMNAIYKKMPAFFGKERRKSEVISILPEIYNELRHESTICAGDFPDVKIMQEKLKSFDFKHLNDLKTSLIDKVDRMLSEDIPRIMTMLPDETMPCVEFKAYK